ncbi:hypothetical protein NNJEOMEG_03046 [Fundidesulfovibrio magnetotacticus]|uniref:Uncharacterized protein n=1 Tax=Fundidesulfovibrio magnetotacticus TaxID=2730080 RepID=A0A6V8LY74_9BACT|nr:hypothetical protein NNJEOMEG_03046 [Fundidesulfovibrio magnetotacticus]
MRTLALAACLAALAAALWLDWRAFRADCRALVARGLTAPADPASPLAQDAFHQAMARDLLGELTRQAPDVLYLNDSVMGGHSAHEARTSLDELLARELARQGEAGAARGAVVRAPAVRGLSGAGYTPLVYGRYGELLGHAARKPRLALISLNPRSFSSDWFFGPDYLYARVTRFLPALGRSPDAALWLSRLPSRLAGQSLEDFLAARGEAPVPESVARAWFRDNARDPAAFGPEPRGLDAYEQGVRARFLENYMSAPVEEEHPMAVQTAQAVRAFVRAGIPVLAYATPVDAEEARRLLGPGFKALLRRDMDALERVVRGAGGQFLDLAELLDSQDFVDRDQACEHLSLSGREKLARALAPAVAAALAR